MFEKEAKEYKLNLISELREKILKGYNCKELVDIEKGFQKGAEFGYNKANEWQYPSKGKYPEEREDVWCYCKGLGIKFCCVGHTIVGGDNKVRWWANNKIEELNVIAWKEIVYPKFSE